MMLNISATPCGEPSASWLRRSAPSAESVRAFLQCGAVFAWSEDRWIIAWGPPEKSARPQPDRPSFYAPDFMLSDPAPWRIYPHATAVSPDGLAQQLGGTGPGRTWHAFDAERFAKTFHVVQEALGRGALVKAVPVVFEHSPGALSEAERARALRALANLPTGLMPYGCWDASGGLLGASPELLFEDDGTAPDEMMEDRKERAEHAVVLDDLAAQLVRLGTVTRGATRLWRIGILSHLRTDLRVTPAHATAFEDLVRLLHPTPAIGVAPRGQWREWIPQLDQESRRQFAAPFGLALPGGTSRCLVAIRHVQWDHQSTRCGAGCGLVAESKLARELSELRLKLAATRGNLGL
jgi:anthranilate/para-aminobenzoate synthase component I